MVSAERMKVYPAPLLMEAPGLLAKTGSFLMVLYRTYFLLTLTHHLPSHHSNYDSHLSHSSSLSLIPFQPWTSSKSERERQRAQHRASQYLIEDGKLWRVSGGTSSRARSRTECVTRMEAKVLALQQHTNNGHWVGMLSSLLYLTRFIALALDQSILEAISDCPQCKNFGSTHLHALLNPITRRHPLSS